jgi:hypothetical protein
MWISFGPVAMWNRRVGGGSRRSRARWRFRYPRFVGTAAIAVAALMAPTAMVWATEVGSVGAIVQGEDAYGSPVGVYGPIAVGDATHATRVDIFGVSDAEAATVDTFHMTYDGTTIESGPDTFAGVSNVQHLASAIDFLSPLIDVSAAGSTIRIEASSNGAVQFDELRLETTIPATRTEVSITNLGESVAAAVNLFTMRVDGELVDSPNFSTVDSMVELAAKLDEIPEVDVYLVGPTTISIFAATPGSVAFTSPSLKVVPRIHVTSSPGVFNEGGSIVVAPNMLVTHGLGVDLMSLKMEVVDPVEGEDLLTYLPGPTDPVGGVYNPSTGVLLMTNTASAGDYQAAARTVVYSNTSQTEEETWIYFQAVDVDGDAGFTSARKLVMNNVNDPPVVATSVGVADYSPGDVLVVDPEIEVTDVDDDTLVGASVQITTGFVEGDDILGFTAAGSVTGLFDAVAGSLDLWGDSTVLDYRAVLRSVTYESTNPNPIPGSLQLAFQVFDPTAGSNSAIREIEITNQILFEDGFESGDTLQWSGGTGVGIDSWWTLN